MGRPKPMIAPAGVNQKHRVKTWDEGSKVKPRTKK